MKELECQAKKFRRSKKLITNHCRSGITKEVAFAMINGLKPDAYVDFDIVGGADKCDIAVDSHLLIDVTTAKIIRLEQLDENTFDLWFTLGKNKMNSIEKRSSGTRYIATDIAFLEQKDGKIYYFGRINKKHFLAKASKTINGRHCFYAKGTKQDGHPKLSNEIILT